MAVDETGLIIVPSPVADTSVQSIDFPFRFQGGSLQLTSNYQRVVRAQLIDSVMTNYRERVMRPDYGADIQSFLFEGVPELRTIDTANLIKQRLIAMVPRATIDSVSVEQDPANRSTVDISVAYRANSYDDPETLQFSITKDT